MIFKKAILVTVLIILTKNVCADIWDCHFSTESLGSRVEIDTKLDLVIENNNFTNEITELSLITKKDKKSITKGYLQKFSFEERKYWLSNEPPLRSRWDVELFIPVSSYDNHKSPGILSGFTFTIDSPTTFTLFRKSSTPDKATAILNTPTVGSPVEGHCRLKKFW